jgi:pimeloyl-ACP methyl ester carboxylesterase
MDDIVRHMNHFVRQVIEKENTNLAGVIGCSIGGVLALRYAMLYPSPTFKIISIAAPGIASPPKAHDLWTQRIAQFEKDVASGTNELCRATVGRWFPNSRPEDDAAREEALGHVKTCSLEGYKILADAIRGYDYSGEEVEGLSGKADVMIVCGEEDAACDLEGMKAVKRRIGAGCEFVGMERTGHLPPMQKKSEFEGIVGRFLGS